MPYTDIFLYDIKHIDSDIHERFTGKPNGIILKNLKHIDEAGKCTEIRIPFIKGVNDSSEVLEKTAEFLSKLKHLRRVRILPYNNILGSKYKAVGMKFSGKNFAVPEKKQIYDAVEIFKTYNIDVIV